MKQINPYMKQHKIFGKLKLFSYICVIKFKMN